MKMYSLDEFIEEEIGGKGTPARNDFDAKVAAKVERLNLVNEHFDRMDGITIENWEVR